LTDTTDLLELGSEPGPDAFTPAYPPADATASSSAQEPVADSESPARRRRAATNGGGLSSLLLPQLQQMASTLGVEGTARLRKGQLIAAIQAAQSGAANGSTAANGSAAANGSGPTTGTTVGNGSGPTTGSTANGSTPDHGSGAADAPVSVDGSAPPQAEATVSPQARTGSTEQSARASGRPGRGERGDYQPRQDRPGQDRPAQDQPRQDRPAQDRPGQDRSGPDRQSQGPDRSGRPDDDSAGGRNRRGRYRDRRNRNVRGVPTEPEPVLRDDDVLVPVAGILDMHDNYAFIRTSGYLAGPNDVYVSMAQVRRYGLRRGDAVTGAVRQQADGERRDKYNALIRLDNVNGLDPEEAQNRPEFGKLVPLYPQDRLRLETDSQALTTRIIDLVAPIGKGQRGLIVSPPKAGKTMVLQAIANAITTNNPECHLMVVLVDERPEEVTDMQRSVKGEVIASTFDRPPADHTTVAELSIERAKRLVELGHDVVVLLDSITRLGRAYNLAAPASGRILSGGVDSTALYPPKRFLGAARNIENGGSLTILATALVETGSTMDTVIFEEFKGTGNMELKLDRRLADKRIFPAVDVDASGTRKEEILLSPDELSIVLKLRRVLHALEAGPALELLLDKMKSTGTNVEFLLQIQKTTPGQD
jgi:transcription termination factor Rho